MTAPPNPARIPKPAHPHRRREPLPWHRPKSSREDEEAPAKLERILQSESYRRADEDVDFLNSDETRADLPTAELVAGDSVVFTRRWTQPEHWEGEDQRVRVDPAPGSPGAAG